MTIIRSASRLAVLGLFLPLVGCAATASEDGDEAVGTTSAALAADHYAFGFAWVNPGSPISAAYSRNSANAPISYSGTGGVYTVTMNELGVSGGSVQVVSYGGAATRCKVGSWGPSGTSLVISVRCHDTTGAAVASPFVVFFNKGHASAGGQHAHLYYSGASVPSTYSFNSTGATNGVTRTATGRYTASLPGMPANAGVHVTAYGSDARHCKIVGWGAGSVNVRCQDNAGALADSPFVINVYGTTPRAFMVGGHAWIEGASSAPAGYQFNQHVYSCGGPNPITVSGFQNVTFPGTNPTGWSQPTTTMTTAYGDDAVFCKVQYWTASGENNTVKSICFLPNGTPTTGRFTSSFMGDWSAPC